MESKVPQTQSIRHAKAAVFISWPVLSSHLHLPLPSHHLLTFPILALLSLQGPGMSLNSSEALRKRTAQRKPLMPPNRLLSITPRGLSEQRKSTSAANRLEIWWATLRKWTVQRKSSMPPIRLLSITPRGWSGRHKSTSAANCSTFWWAYPMTPRVLTEWCKSASAANLSESRCSPGRQMEKRKPSMPLLCWSRLGHTRTLGGATGQRKSTSAANLLQPQRPQEALTVRRKTSMPPICWALLGLILMPRSLTGRRKSASVARLLEPRCPQVVPMERHKPSMPPIFWLLSGPQLPLRSATVKRKSLKAADLLQSWWAPAPPTVRRKSRRAAKLLMGAGAFSFPFFSFWVRCERCKIPYGSSIAPRLVRVAKWKNAPSSCCALCRPTEGHRHLEFLEQSTQDYEADGDTYF